MSLREQIIESALELCARSGITATSVQDIADAAQCSKANVLYHFSHKEDLINEALQPSLVATTDLIARAESRGLDTDTDRIAFVGELVELLLSHRLAHHIVITHPYLVDSVPALARAQEVMGYLAELVATKTHGDVDRVSLGIAIAGVSYALVSQSTLGLDTADDHLRQELLTEALVSMVIPQQSTIGQGA